MPGLDGTGPNGTGPVGAGRGVGAARGRGVGARAAGRGVGRGLGRGQAAGAGMRGRGGTKECVCPECGETKSHPRGIPCTEFECSKCGAQMNGRFCAPSDARNVNDAATTKKSST